jgi:tetratricopeptide (TPR) repeat protein
MTLDDLKLTVARTSGPTLPDGTAFLVSATHALTCAHCIRDSAGGFAESVELNFWNDARERHAAVEAVDEDRDVALLRLSLPATVPAYPRATNAVNGARWQAFGYPKDTPGLLIGGEVRDVNARTGQQVVRHVIQLECREAADALKGASGSPVLVNDVIVGMITRQAQKWSRTDAGGTEPAFGALFAVSMAQVATVPSMRNAVALPPAADGPATEPTQVDLFQQYRQIVEAMPKLTSVKVPGSGGAFETVPLESIYVEPELSGLRTIDDIWSRRRLAVVGEEGLGKGAFLKALNLRLLRAANRGEDALWPLHVELDRYAGQTDRADLMDFALDDVLGRREDDGLRAHVKSCGQQGRVVLFCDGLEHVGAGYERVIDALSRQPRFVVGVRPGARMDVGQESGGTLRLQPFDRRRIEAFIGKWADSIAHNTGSLNEDQLLRDIVSQPSLLELAGMPRFLGLICAVASGGKTVVATRTALISSAWDTVWQAALGAESFARRQGTARTLQQLARAIFERGASVSREFDEEELYDALGRAGEREPDAVVARLIEHEIIAPGRDSGSASRSFRFPLDGFREYLAAESLAGDDAFLKTLTSLPIDSRWAQILPLVTGVLARAQKSLPLLRVFLSDLSALATGESLGLHICLVAECLAEVPADRRAGLAPFPQETAEKALEVFIDQPITLGRMMPPLRRLQPPSMRRDLENILEDRGRPLDQRSAAVYALSAFTDQKAFETLAHLATHGDAADVRVAACLGLASFRREEAGGVLVAALRDQEFRIRLTAARCLGRRQDRDRASMVLSAWLDSRPQKAGNDFLRAVEAVGWMAAIVSLRPEATVPALLDRLTGGGEDEVPFAAQVFAETGTRGAAWPGIQILNSAANDTVRQVVTEMLFRLGSEAAIAALRQALARGDEAAKLGVLFGYGAAELLRTSPAADLLINPVEASLTWSMVARLEADLLEAQKATMREFLDAPVAERGREAVLAEARAALMQGEAGAEGAARRSDLLNDLAKVFSGNDGDWKRAAAFETIQLLEEDSELLVNALFDADSAVALQAAGWIRIRPSDLPIGTLLDRLDASPRDAASLSKAAAMSALGRLQYLRMLVEHCRKGSRTAAQALWLLSVQFGFHLYDDGRIELPDGQIETDYEKVAERLNQFDAAAARNSADAVSEVTLALKGAEAEFHAAGESRPSDGAGWASRAAIELSFGQTDRARQSVTSAIEADNSTALWFRFRGLLCYSGGAYAEAASDFERAIALGDGSSTNFVGAGLALGACGEFERAVTMFSAAIEGTPDHPDALFGRACARFELSRFQEAVEDLDALLAKVPDHAGGVRLRAQANARLSGPDATQANTSAC